MQKGTTKRTYEQMLHDALFVCSFLRVESTLFYNHATMKIAVIAMAMMQLPIVEIVNMISMRNRRMATILMTTVTRYRRTGIRMSSIDCNNMLIIMVLMRCMEMTIMYVIGMTIVFNGYMSTIC
jgi:hypothetical protein